MKKFLMMYRFPLLVYLVALIVIGYRIDNDTYYLLALGRAIEHLGIPTTDPLIMGGDYPVVIQQWLYALSLWKLYSMSGMIGVYIVSMVAGLGILLIFYRICLLVSDKNIFLSQTITLYFAIFFYLLSYGAVTRPQVFSSLMLIGALFLLERMARGKTSPKALLWLIPLSVLFINLHASMWPLLSFLIGVYWLESVIPAKYLSDFCLPPEHPQPRLLLLTLAGVLIAGLLNPYGVDAMMYSTQAARGVAHFHEMISEMQHLSIGNQSVILVIAMDFVITAIYARHRAYLRYLILTFVTIFLSFESFRSLQHFFLLGLFPVAFLLKDVHTTGWLTGMLRKWLQKPVVPLLLAALALLRIAEYWERMTEIWQPCLAAGCLLLLAAGAVRFSLVRRRKLLFLLYGGLCLLSLLLVTDRFLHVQERNDEIFPSLTAVADDLSSAPEDVKLYAEFGGGSPAEFFGFKPYLDTRPEIFAVYGHENRWNEFCDLAKGTLYYQDFLDEHDFDYVIAQKGRGFDENMKHAVGYRNFYEDENYVVYKRAGENK